MSECYHYHLSECYHYHPLLMWAVVRKMRKGMEPSSVEREYGIPELIASNWLFVSRRFDPSMSDWSKHD